MRTTGGPLGRASSGSKVAAQHRGDPQHRQIAGVEVDAVELLRIVLDQVGGVRSRALNGHGFEGLLIVAPIEEESAHHEFLLFKRMHQPDRDQPVVVRIGQRAEENPVDHAEDRRRRANAQRQRRNHRNREDPVAPESAQRIAHILRHRAHPPAGPLLVALLARPLHAAKFNQRLPPRFCLSHACSDVSLD